MRYSFGLLASASILALLGGHSALAQTAAEAQVEEVVVTGSRLQSGFSAPTPVKVLGAQVIEQRAPAAVSEITNELPGFRVNGPTNNTRGITGTTGQAPLDLRGLGSTRTLVLLDGRRMVSNTITNTIDSNNIPSSLIDRVEVVTGGASAAYGSDAISGVVNFILKDRIQGVQGNAQYGISERGDNEQWSVSLATGMQFNEGRGRLVVGGDYSDTDGTGSAYTRDYGKAEPGLVPFGTTRAAGVPAQGYLMGVELSSLTPGSIVTSGPLKGTAFDANGQPYAFKYGTVLGTQMVGSDANYGNNQFTSYQLSYPYSRGAGMARLSYDFTPTITGFIEGGFGYLNNSGAKSNTPQTVSIIVSRDNPFLPAATRAAMVAANVTTLNVGRWNTDFGAWNSDNTTKTHRFVAGLRGKVFEDWSWEASVQTGKTVQHLLNTNMPHDPNFLAAAYVITGANGQPACAPVASNPNLTAARAALVVPGCVPFNIFGTGRASAEAYKYVAREQTTRDANKLNNAAFCISGSPLSTWAGEVQLALGAEYRKQSLDRVGDPLSQGGVSPFTFGNNQSYSGSETVKEYFVEVGVPIARDMPLARSLELNGAYRRTDYSTSGIANTWKIGLTYEPIEALRFRATQSRDIRAPNINERFGTGTIGTATSYKNPFNGQIGNLTTRSSGNLLLTPEIADTLTAGIVVQPTGWAAGLRGSLDFYDITIHDVVGSVSGQDAINRCFAGQAEYCATITFDNTVFGIALARTQNFNINKLHTRGLDVDIQYRVPLDQLPGALPGRFDVRLLYTFVHDLTTTDAVGPLDRVGVALNGIPKSTGNFTATYALGRFLGSLQVRYNGKMRGDINLIGPEDDGYSPTSALSINKNLWPESVYYNLQAQYDLLTGQRKLQVFGVINNLLDKKPPAFSSIAMNTNGATNVYDLVGRSFKAGIRFAF